MNYSPNTFTYSGKQYTLNITLYTSTGSEKTDLHSALTGNEIEVFEYSTKLNSLLVEGKVLYVDRYAEIDKFLS